MRVNADYVKESSPLVCRNLTHNAEIGHTPPRFAAIFAAIERERAGVVSVVLHGFSGVSDDAQHFTVTYALQGE